MKKTPIKKSDQNDNASVIRPSGKRSRAARDAENPQDVSGRAGGPRRFMAVCVGFLIVTVVCVLGNALYVRLTTSPLPTPTAMAVPEDPERTRYVLSLSYDPNLHTMTGTQTIDYFNATQLTLTELLINLPANAYQTAETAPVEMEISEFTYPEGFSPGNIHLSKIVVPGQTVTNAIGGTQDTQLRIGLQSPLVPHARVSIELAYTMQLPHASGRFGWDAETVRLCNMLPIMARLDEDGWYEDDIPAVGESLNAEIADWNISLTLPKGMKVASSGMLTGQTVEGNQATFTYDAPLIRGYGVVFSRMYQVYGKMAGNTAVFAYSFTRNAGQRALDFAAKALSAYEELYGDYPYPTYSVVEAQMPTDALSAPNLSMIDPEFYSKEAKDYQEMLIAMQTSFQWWGNLVGNDSIRFPWMSETLAAYSSLRYFRHTQDATVEKYIDEAFLLPLYENYPDADHIRLDQSTDKYGEWPEYWGVLLGKGIFLWQDLEEFCAVGQQDTLLQGLQAYVSQFRYRIADPDDLITAVHTTVNRDVRPIFRQWLTGEDQ